MTLRYRGIDYTPPVQSVELTETEVLGLYRGLPWRRCQIVQGVPVPQHVEQLKYRGVSYTIGVPGGETAAQPQAQTLEKLYESAPAQRVVPPAGRPTNKTARQLAMEASDRVHDEVIRQSLERRLGIARSKGDTTLIQLLEREAEQIHSV